MTELYEPEDGGAAKAVHEALYEPSPRPEVEAARQDLLRLLGEAEQQETDQAHRAAASAWEAYFEAFHEIPQAEAS